jgi:hypothetical protein
LNSRPEPVRVADDWHEELPVTEEELQLLECHLGELIAAMID